MKPAPFDAKYTYNAPSGVKLVSIRDDGDGYSINGVTTVFGADGSTLYKMHIFTGRRSIYLSPDGSVVVLDGNIYFGQGLMRSSSFDDDQIVTSVYQKGKVWKEIRYKSDLNGETLEKQLGGGWAERPFEIDVSWDRNLLIYDMKDGSANREILLPVDIQLNSSALLPADNR